MVVVLVLCINLLETPSLELAYAYVRFLRCFLNLPECPPLYFGFPSFVQDPIMVKKVLPSVQNIAHGACLVPSVDRAHCFQSKLWVHTVLYL